MGTMIVLFALIGPFGTFESMALPKRFLYWSFCMLSCWTIATVTISFLEVLCEDRDIQPLVLFSVGAVLATFPMAVWLHHVVPLVPGFPDSSGYWSRFLDSLPISLTFSMIVYFALSGSFRDDEAEKFRQLDNPLQKRLSPEKRGPVRHMSMQDHYISVTTTRGSELVLMRMSDAVAALREADGLQIHRSHWVSKEAVVGSTRENGQPIVVLADETRLPVSRSFTKSAREAGII